MSNIQEILKVAPLIAAWIAELGYTPEDVKRIRFNLNTYRDEAREVREGSQWQIWVPGEYYTVIIVFTDGVEEVRSWRRQEWEMSTGQ